MVSIIFAYKICLYLVAGFISLRVSKSLSSGNDHCKRRDATRVATFREIENDFRARSRVRSLVICKLGS